MADRQRYQHFSSDGAKIHPFKRVASWLAPCLPRAWRFWLLGLPPRSDLSPEETGGRSADFHEVTNGIACQNGAHLDASGAYLPHLTLGTGRFIEFRFLQRQRLLPRLARAPGAVLSLASEGDVNYYRWLVETLPRFRFVEESGAKFDAIYGCQQQPFHRESLEFFGGGNATIIPSGEKRFVRAARLVLPRFVDECETWVIPWMRERVLPRLGANRSGEGPRIYVSRKNAGGRRLANEAELLRELEPLGFRPVVLEGMAWLDQARLFRDAEAVVAPHGAGLANLVFASPGTTVVELIAPEYPFTFYPEICRRVKLRHHLVHGRALEPARVYGSDLQVDVARVRALLS